MKEEREGLLKDLAKLKTALQHLAARNQGTVLSSLHIHACIRPRHAKLLLAVLFAEAHMCSVQSLLILMLVLVSWDSTK